MMVRFGFQPDAQFVIVLLGPLGRAQQSGFFSVPRAIDDGALRLPAGLDQLAERPRFFQDGNLSGDGILRAVYPGIVMVAANHPLIGESGARNFPDDVVERLDIPVGLHFEVQLGYQAALRRHRENSWLDRKSTRLNSSHLVISYAVFCLKK